MPKRLAFFCSSTSWGGLEINTLRYAIWLKEAGYSVKVFAQSSSRIYSEAQKIGIEPIPILPHRKYNDWKAAWRFSNMFQRHQIELVFFRDNRDFDVLAWAKRFSLSRFKLLYYQAMQLGGAKRNIFHALRFSACDAWVCTLPFLQKQVETLTTYSTKRTHVVPLGVELVEPLQNLRVQLKIKDTDFLVGIIGRIDPQKDQLSAIHALHCLSKELPNLHLLIVGESTLNEGNTYEKELKRKVNHLHLSDRIHFMPFTSDVASVYNALDVFLMTSLGETFGTVTIEALGYGVPVIGTNTSGTPEILDHGKCGLLFTPSDVEQLSQHILLLAQHRDKRMKLVEEGKKAFHQYYSKKASVNGIKKVIDSLFHP